MFIRIIRQTIMPFLFIFPAGWVYVPAPPSGDVQWTERAFQPPGRFFSIAGSATYSLSAGSLPKLRQHNYVISYCDERGGLSTYIFVNCKRSDRSAHLLHRAYEYTAEAGNRTGLLRSAY